MMSFKKIPPLFLGFIFLTMFFFGLLTMDIAADRNEYLGFFADPTRVSRLNSNEMWVFMVLGSVFPANISVAFLIAVTSTNIYFAFIHFSGFTAYKSFLFTFALVLILSPFILTQLRFTFAASLVVLGILCKLRWISIVLYGTALTVHLAVIPTIFFIIIRKFLQKVSLNFLNFAVFSSILSFLIPIVLASLLGFINNEYFALYLLGKFNGSRYTVSFIIYFIILVFFFALKNQRSDYDDFIFYGGVLIFSAFISGFTFIYKVTYPFYVLSIFYFLRSIDLVIRPKALVFAVIVGLFPLAFITSILRL